MLRAGSATVARSPPAAVAVVAVAVASDTGADVVRPSWANGQPGSRPAPRPAPAGKTPTSDTGPAG